jgi:hypothetical protein
VLFLEFAKAIEGQQRAYDWNNKVTWGMSVPELSTILATPNQQHDFFHDPGGCVRIGWGAKAVVGKRRKRGGVVHRLHTVALRFEGCASSLPASWVHQALHWWDVVLPTSCR